MHYANVFARNALFVLSSLYYTEKIRVQNVNYPIFPIISSSAVILVSSSDKSDSLLLDASSVFVPIVSSHHTFTRVSSFCDCNNSIFCFSRNVFKETSGVAMSARRELMYLVLSKRFHLFAFFSMFSSLITRTIICEKVDESFSNPE